MSEGENKAQTKPASGAAPGGENTVGKVIPQTSPAPAGGKSQPDKAWYEQVWDGFMKSVAKDHLEAVGFGIEAGSLDPQGNAEKVGALAFDQLKEYVDSIKERIPGGKPGARAKQSQQKPGKAEPAKQKQDKKPEAAPAGGKKANSGGGGYTEAKVEQVDPTKKCGRKQAYSDKKGVKGTGLEKDHTPSSKALQAAAMKEMEPLIGKSLTKGQAEKIAHAVSEKAPTIAIPHDVHKAGDTWGSGKNTPTQIAQDAGDLNGAAKRNTEKISEIMADKKHGCNDAYNKAAEEITSMDWNKFVKDTIADKLPKPKT